MPELLYLDTARLGLMSPRACRASVDFARFAGEYGATLYLTDFLKDGFSSLPSRLASSYSGLEDWHGVTALRKTLLEVAGADPSANVLVASRAATLMQIAARLLVRPCNNIFVTDVSWPAYQHTLQRAAHQCGSQITTVKIRRDLLRGKLTADELIVRIVTQFSNSSCDGLFLPLVDNLGVQIPISRIVASIRKKCELRLAVVDAAQAYNHVSLDETIRACDVVIAGCHKWLNAFTPMGVGFFGRTGSCDYIRDSVCRWKRQGRIDDPLMQFADELELNQPRQFGETVSISPLLTSNGAAVEALEKQVSRDIIESNVDSLTSIAESHRWRTLVSDPALSSRIMLMQSGQLEVQKLSSESLRRRFLDRGIALSSYAKGIIRVALPTRCLTKNDLVRLDHTLSRTF